MTIHLSGELLILTGTPGAGKSTTARALCARPGSAKVHLHADDFWAFIRHGAIAPHLPQSHEQNKVVIDVLAKAAEGYARGGYFVVLDGIVGPWFLEPFRALTVPLHYLVLRPSLDVAIDRCRQRGGDTLAEPVAITSLHRQLAALGQLEPHVLRTEGHSPEQTLNELIVALHSGAFRLSST